MYFELSPFIFSYYLYMPENHKFLVQKQLSLYFKEKACFNYNVMDVQIDPRGL